MSDFLHHYLDIMSDPAHLAAEVSLMLLVDVLFLGMIWPLVRKAMDRRIHAEHHVIDREHGITHGRDDADAVLAHIESPSARNAGCDL